MIGKGYSGFKPKYEYPSSKSFSESDDSSVSEESLDSNSGNPFHESECIETRKTTLHKDLSDKASNHQILEIYNIEEIKLKEQKLGEDEDNLNHFVEKINADNMMDMYLKSNSSSTYREATLSGIKYVLYIYIYIL